MIWKFDFIYILCMSGLFVIVFAIILAIVIAITIVRYYASGYQNRIKNSCLYIGRVKHTRLKGGAMHKMDYPIFFSCIDLNEMADIGWNMWPIFKLDSKSIFTFCSLDNNQHLKGYKEETPSIYNRLQSFVNEKSNQKLSLNENKQITLLVTHLTYFGYCFNPISIYYIINNDINKQIDYIVAEVSNTPWIEQHAYILHSEISNVEINRLDNSYYQAIWNKEFHVSPFMEMLYKYNFIFSNPMKSILINENENQNQTINESNKNNKSEIIVNSKMIRTDTNELYFVASFKLEKIEFTPINLLYVLLYYPLHTRMIQILIHYEALKLLWKGIPTFAHPNNTTIHFGFGITDKLLIKIGNNIINYYEFIINSLKSIFNSISTLNSNMKDE